MAPTLLSLALLWRVELAGETWTVWSRPGAGTVLTASLPKALVAA